MPRPRKWRTVEFVQGGLHLVPVGRPACEGEEEILKVEELEAVRLKDLLNLSQDECAGKMQVSRQTFQRILGDARSKVARALVEGKALKVEGGNFTRSICRLTCCQCSQQWEESYENQGQESTCPRCGSEEIQCCNPKKEFCLKGCCKERGKG